MFKTKQSDNSGGVFLTGSILARLEKLGLEIVESDSGKVSSDKELISPVFISWGKPKAGRAGIVNKIKLRLLAAGNPDKFNIQELVFDQPDGWPNSRLKEFYGGVAWLANPRSIKHIPADLGDLWREIALVVNELDYLGVPEFESSEFIIE